MSVLLSVNQLSVTFGGLHALKEVSLSITEGSIHGLIGPNGAGKSTLVNALTGMAPLASGSIELAGEILNGLPTHAIARAGIGRTFQNIRLFSGMTVLENTMVGAHRHFRTSVLGLLFRTPAARTEESERRSMAMQEIDFVGLAERENQIATTLAYGHQRRLEIARALMLNPRLLLLDEPMAGMNTTEKDELADLIRAVRDRGATVLIIEHDMQVIRQLADQLTVLHHGELLANGPPKDVFADPAVQDAYLGRAT
jgi:branched-chain amino acid transport system ATP-binding protein